MNIVFMGTPDFARESLDSVYKAGYNILAVVTNPDKPKGRGMKMLPSPVKEYAVLKNIPVYQPEKVKKNEEFIETLRNLNPDIICVVAYGKILPKEVLEIKIKFWKVQAIKETDFEKNISNIEPGEVILADSKKRFIYKNKRWSVINTRNSRRKCKKNEYRRFLKR